jgi:RNA polymerase-binding transcription factor DksA
MQRNRQAAAGLARSSLGVADREYLRERLLAERARIQGRVARDEANSSEHRHRVSERDPCAVLSPAAATEDAEHEVRSRQALEAVVRIRELDRALHRLHTEPEAFGVCVRCREAISLARLDVLPATTLCERCAGATR